MNSREFRLPVVTVLGASANSCRLPEKALLRRQALTPYSSLEAAEIVLPCSRNAHHPIQVLAPRPLPGGDQSPIARNTDERRLSLAHVPEIRFQSPRGHLLRFQDTISSIRLLPPLAHRRCRPSLSGAETKRVALRRLVAFLNFGVVGHAVSNATKQVPLDEGARRSSVQFWLDSVIALASKSIELR